jgi:uncharacterized protein
MSTFSSATTPNKYEFSGTNRTKHQVKPMKDIEQEIVRLIKEIETEHKVKVIFAVENGSRAWNMYSKNSDYDVRFVFRHPLTEYLNISRPSEVIEKKHVCDGEDIDMAGFDIRKFMSMLLKSNPTTIEWCQTPIVYYGKCPADIDVIAELFNRNSLNHHYRSMCRDNYMRYIRARTTTYKKYLYAMRGLVNAKWVLEFGTLPPMDLKEALSRVDLDARIKEKLTRLIDMKRSGNEKDATENIASIDTCIESFLNEKADISNTTNIDYIGHRLRKK